VPKDRDYWRLAAIHNAGGPEPALIVGSEAFALGPLGVDGDILALLRNWEASVPALDAAFSAVLGGEGRAVSLKQAQLMAPYTPPGLFCAGANYYDHIREMSPHPDPKPPKQPFFFLKSPAHCVVGPRAAVPLPQHDCGLDWEAEIAVVIGRKARHVREAQALDYVAGYTILNDLSARGLMKRDDGVFGGYDWIAQKVFPGSAPMGPWITPAKLIADPQNLAVKLWLNGEIRQDSSSREMVFSVAEQIAYLSRRVGLEPGDMIATGTPAGCGRPRGEALKAGDVIRIEIEGLGPLEHTIVAPDIAS